MREGSFTMSTYYAIENGVLVQRLFVGPIQQVVKERVTIAKRDERLETVSEVELMHVHLKEQQLAASLALGNVDGSSTKETNVKRFQKKIIRRRKAYVYHAADKVIDQGYWSRERRSLTKYHSNSLMFEYSLLK